MPKALICLFASLVVVSPAIAADPGPPAQPINSEAAQHSELFLFLFSAGPNWRPGVPMRGQDLRAHGSYYAGLLRDGRLFAGGGFTDANGGMAIVRAANRAEAEKILAADPAILNGVFTAEIRNWRPRFHGSEPLMTPAR
jgi:uncharacterized protein YciI